MTYTERRTNKYGAKKCEYNGYIYDSKFEASIAELLDWRLKAKEILGWERQFKVEMQAYDHTGKPVLSKSHKVDFRVSELDGSFTLIEAKGFETPDYKERRKWLEKLWLPQNLDHKYEVVKQVNHYRPNFKAMQNADKLQFSRTR